MGLKQGSTVRVLPCFAFIDKHFYLRYTCSVEKEGAAQCRLCSDR